MKKIAIACALILPIATFAGWKSYAWYRQLMFRCEQGFIDPSRAQASEGDMFFHTQGLTEDAPKEIVAEYRRVRIEAAESREELGRRKTTLMRLLLLNEHPDPEQLAAAKKALFDLQQAQTAHMIDGMTKIANLSRGSTAYPGLDPESFIRALLREHRRTIPGFKP